MTTDQIISELKTRFGDAVRNAHAEDKHPRIHVDAADWRPIAEHLRRDPQLAFDWLANLSGLDYAADLLLAVCYDFWSVTHRHSFAVKVYVDRAAAAVPSVADLWPAANWQEREAFDLLGIRFPGHPDLRRILLAEDWEGHPLRKDYVFPRSYHDIPASVELDWQQSK